MNADTMVKKLLGKLKYETKGSVYKKGEPAYFEGEHLFEYNADHHEFWERLPKHNKRVSEINAIVQKHKSDTRNRFSFGDLFDVYNSALGHTGRSVVRLYGGFNGRHDPHKWSNYLLSVADFIKDLEERFGHAWMIEWHNNCSDCHAVNIAFEDETKGTIERAKEDWNNRIAHGEKTSAIFDLGYAEDIKVLEAIYKAHVPYFSLVSDRCFLMNVRTKQFFCLGEFDTDKAYEIRTMPQEVWGEKRKTPFGRFMVAERWLDESKVFYNTKLGDDKHHFFDSLMSALYQFAKACDGGYAIKVGTEITVCSACNIVWDGKKWVSRYREEGHDFIEHANHEFGWFKKHNPELYNEIVEYIG